MFAIKVWYSLENSRILFLKDHESLFMIALKTLFYGMVKAGVITYYFVLYS